MKNRYEVSLTRRKAKMDTLAKRDRGKGKKKRKAESREKINLQTSPLKIENANMRTELRPSTGGQQALGEKSGLALLPLYRTKRKSDLK